MYISLYIYIYQNGYCTTYCVLHYNHKLAEKCPLCQQTQMDVNFYSCSRSFIFTYHVDTDNKTRFLPFLVVSFPLLRRPLKQINGEDKQHVCYAWLKDHGQKFVSSLHILAKQPWLSFQNFLDFQVLAKQQMLVINPSFSFFG